MLYSMFSLKLKVKITHLCLTFCDPMDCIVHGILQARILEWVAFPFSRGSSNTGIKPLSPTLQEDSFPAEPPRNFSLVSYFIHGINSVCVNPNIPVPPTSLSPLGSIYLFSASVSPLLLCGKRKENIIY